MVFRSISRAPLRYWLIRLTDPRNHPFLPRIKHENSSSHPGPFWFRSGQTSQQRTASAVAYPSRSRCCPWASAKARSSYRSFPPPTQSSRDRRPNSGSDSQTLGTDPSSSSGHWVHRRSRSAAPDACCLGDMWPAGRTRRRSGCWCTRRGCRCRRCQDTCGRRR